jgi:hypothetical protein
VLTSSEVYDLVSRIGDEVDNIQAVSTEIDKKNLLFCEYRIFEKNLKPAVHDNNHACLYSSQYRNVNGASCVCRTRVKCG